jgi:hypothetical protein
MIKFYITLLFAYIKNKILRRVRTPKGDRLLEYCQKIVEDEGYQPTSYEEMMFEDVLQDLVNRLKCPRVEAACYYGTVLSTFDKEK